MAGESEVMMEEAERHEAKALDLRSRAEELEGRARDLLLNLDRGMPLERELLAAQHNKNAFLLREEAEKHGHEARMLRQKAISGEEAAQRRDEDLARLVRAARPASDRDPWARRSEGMRCHSCMWFAPKGEGDIGRCRRHAPTITGYPVVFTADWCGDHKLNEEAIR